jgi:hypothetical protein
VILGLLMVAAQLIDGTRWVIVFHRLQQSWRSGLPRRFTPTGAQSSSEPSRAESCRRHCFCLSQ